MHAALVTAWCDWLNGVNEDGTPNGLGHAVNDYLPLVPRLAIDAAAPIVVGSIVDRYRDNNAAAFNTPNTARAIYVLPDGPIVGTGQPGPTTRTVKSAAATARVIVADANEAAAMRWAENVVRAIGLSTAAWLDDTNDSMPSRTRAGVYVVAANRVTFGPWAETVGEAAAVGIFAIDCELRDHSARL